MKSTKILIAERGRDEPLSLGGVLLAGKKVAPDALELLMQDHLEALGYFEWYRQAKDAGAKAAVAGKLCAALRAHMEVEEEILYPAAHRATGDEALVDRAIEEHEEAKQLVDALEASLRGPRPDDTVVARLRKSIEQHVAEEESTLFPKLRASDLDLYELGRELAARRLELLFVLSGKYPAQANPKETPMTPVSPEEARALFITGLKNAHATERQCRTMVQNQIARLESYPAVAKRMKRHLEEVEAQIARLEEILGELGESPSALKDGAMSIAGSMGTMMNAAADDEILKNSFTSFALTNFEIAAYEALLTLGEAAGERQAIRLLQSSLNEERDMASWLADNLRGTVVRHLQLRSEGAQASH
jgi:ferritin-like metal-binding protein YciE/hemerythrin-like domain-containing protein